MTARLRAGARSTTLPPPVGGWDTRNALADMPVANAVILDNWFPETDKVTLRRGCAAHATGLSGAVETLMPYTPPSGAAKLFAANAGKLYDVTAGGAIGAAAASGFTSDRWQFTHVANAGGNFLLAMNGQDAPQLYDGASWTGATFTGPTVASLAWCNLHQRRVWFGERDSLKAWYLGADAIAGAATAFSLGGLAKLGGSIVAMGTWSRDSGDGSDDVAVFLTSEGEAIVYEGTDPASAATWGLVGVFRIGRPVGRRCLIKAGADLILVTQDGFVAASSILVADRAQAEAVAISQQINKAVNDAVRGGANLFGWQPFIYPKGAMLIFNVPQSGTAAHQYVFNTITKAPCRFTGLNAACWGLLGDAAYFGGLDGKVYVFDAGGSDDGAAIAGDALQAFSAFGAPGQKKAFKAVEPLFQSNRSPNVALDLNLDYRVKRATGVALASPETGARWGASRWGIGTWGSASQIYRGVRGVRGIGFAASLRVRVSSTSARPSWVATRYLYLPGGAL